MTSGAFAAAFPFQIVGVPIGTLIATIALILFVFTTLLTWSYYGERAITFLYDRVPGSSRAGEKVLHMVWRVLWCVVIYVGATPAVGAGLAHGRHLQRGDGAAQPAGAALLSGVVFKLARGRQDRRPRHTPPIRRKSRRSIDSDQLPVAPIARRGAGQQKGPGSTCSPALFGRLKPALVAAEKPGEEALLFHRQDLAMRHRAIGCVRIGPRTAPAVGPAAAE